jgi:hypothetical protein
MPLLQSQTDYFSKGGIDGGSSFHFNKTILLSVPANKIAPGRLSFGMGSPVMAASSTVVSPEIIFPSNGIISPGFT